MGVEYHAHLVCIRARTSRSVASSLNRSVRYSCGVKREGGEWACERSHTRPCCCPRTNSHSAGHSNTPSAVNIRCDGSLMCVSVVWQTDHVRETLVHPHTHYGVGDGAPLVHARGSQRARGQLPTERPLVHDERAGAPR